MSQRKEWIDTATAAGNLGNPANIMPGKIFGFAETFEVAAADDDGSVFYLARLPASLIPLSLKLNCDAISGATSYDMGLYSEAGDVLDANCFASAVDIHAGAAMGSEIEMLAAVALSDIGSKKIYEFAGHTVENKHEGYILALTANTIGTAAGTISVRGTFLQG